MSSYSWVAAADTANMQAGGQSFFDKTTDFLTKGLGGAVVSGTYAMLNTGIDFANHFGAGAERFDTLKTLQDFDQNWAQYYKENQTLVDGAGLFLGSLIPGTLAIKGLRAAAAAGESAGAFSRVLGFAAGREQAALQAALSDLATQGGTVFNTLNKNKMAAMAWGTANQALEAAAYETATVLTMKSSPILENTEWKDVMWDVAKTAMAGGVLGGGINALFTNKIMKDAGKLVGQKQRMYDVLTTMDGTNLSFGDKAFAVQDAIAGLPQEALDALTKLPFKYAKDGVLDTSALMNSTLRGTVDRGYVKLTDTITNFANAQDKTIGRAMSEGILGIVREHQAQGLPQDALNLKLGEYLWNLHQVDGIGSRPTHLGGSVEWLVPNADFSKGNIFSSTKPLNPGAKAYRILDEAGMDAARVFTLGKDAATWDEAIKAGADAVIDPTKRTFRISPHSELFQELKPGEENFVSTFLHTRTMQTADTAVATVADIATAKSPLKVDIGGVLSGKKVFPMKLSGFQQDTSALEQTARYAWASQKGVKISGDIAANDFALMDALIQDADRFSPGTRVFSNQTMRAVEWESLNSPETFVFMQKYERAIQLLEKSGEKGDLREIALQLNVEPKWLQQAVDTRFSQKELFADKAGWSRPLGSYMQRENVLLHYDASKLHGAAERAAGAVAYAQRVKMASDTLNNAAASVLGTKWFGLLPELGADFTRQLDQQAVGPTMVGASNAAINDTVRLNAQYIGTITDRVTAERVNAALSTLQSHAGRLMENPKAAAEVSTAITKLRLTGEAYSLYVDPLTGKSALVDMASYKSYMAKGAAGGAPAFKEVLPLSEEAGSFLSAHHNLHAARVEQQSVLQRAQGLEARWDPDRFYAPPIDTRRVPYFAFVRQPEGQLFSSSEVAMVTAKNAAELEKRAADLRTSGYDVIMKSDTERWFKANAAYDFNRTMNAPEIDSLLRKQGKLGDVFPNMTPQAVVEDFIQYTQRAETKLVRDAVSARYQQQINELTDLSNRYTAAQQSRFLGFDKWQKDRDPFGDTVNLMMNVSKKGEYALWHQANEFVDGLGKRAYAMLDTATADARAGKISWEEANTMMERFGMGSPFKSAEQFVETQSMGDRNLIKLAMNKANMLLVNGMLRLDAANSLLNVLSTPILLGGQVSAVRRIVQDDPALAARFAELTTLRVPGTQEVVPNATKLIFNAVKNYWSDDSARLLQRYTDIGSVKHGRQIFHELIDDLTLQPKLLPAEWSAKVEAAIEKGAKFSGSEKAEEFTRFVTANVMHQITQPLVDAGKMAVAEQNSWISTFVNKVQGNYVASQRPILFQGTLGSAVGLFQTYQFNMFQQLFKNIENRDWRSLAVIGGLQSTLYGLHGLPFFDAINTQILGGANSNPGHYDLYTAAVQAFGKEAGDWLMYGSASAFPLFGQQAPALWSRGDLNPRSITMIPVSPTEVPAYQASMKAIAAVTGMASQVMGGSSLKDALLFGLEHNGMNRPLSGLASVMQGYSTTAQGDLISANNDFLSVATAARLIGAKPMDESIALNTVYTSRAYDAMDKVRIDKLATVVKQKLRNGEQPSEEDWNDLLGKYAAAGGRIEGFQKAVLRWQKSANISITQEVMKHSQTQAGKRMILLLGGEPLESMPPETEPPQ